MPNEQAEQRRYEASLKSTLGALLRRLKKLSKTKAKKLEATAMKKKGLWETFGPIISAFVAAVATVVVGYITGVFADKESTKQMIHDEALFSRQQSLSTEQLRVLELQTMEKFLGHLQSQSSHELEVTLLVISALGNEVLASKLTKLFKETESVNPARAQKITDAIDQQIRLKAQAQGQYYTTSQVEEALRGLLEKNKGPLPYVGLFDRLMRELGVESGYGRELLAKSFLELMSRSLEDEGPFTMLRVGARRYVALN